MVLTFVLSQCFIVKLLTKPILLRILWHYYTNSPPISKSWIRPCSGIPELWISIPGGFVIKRVWAWVGYRTRKPSLLKRLISGADCKAWYTSAEHDYEREAQVVSLRDLVSLFTIHNPPVLQTTQNQTLSIYPRVRMLATNSPSKEKKKNEVFFFCIFVQALSLPKGLPDDFTRQWRVKSSGVSQ